MKRIEQVFAKLTNVAPKGSPLAVLFACLTFGSGNLLAQQVFHDWTATGISNVTNKSTAGTITGTNATFGVTGDNFSAPAITTAILTTGFNLGAVGSFMDFSFSTGYAWGNGGQMIIGNIHNYFE